MQGEFGKTRQVVVIARVANAEQHHHWIGQHPAGHECQRLPRRSIDPLRVVDDADGGTVRAGFAKECEDGQPHQEPVGCVALAEAQRDFERISLRHW
jgi:hypothetical protein